MRIVCWNMQGIGYGALRNATKVLKDFETRFEADVMIVLEAPTSLYSSKASARNANSYIFETVPAARPEFRNDMIVVGSKYPINVDVRDTGSEANYIVVDVATPGKSVRIVTFHAPYKNNQGDAPVFRDTVFAEIGKMPVKPDIVLGDINTYADSNSRSAAKNGYDLSLASPTSDHGMGSPLDKIWVKSGTVGRCGRILQTDPGHQYGAMNPKDRLGGAVDLQFDWDLIDKPDHIPIYIDLGGPGAPAKKARKRVTEVDLADINAVIAREKTLAERKRRNRPIGLLDEQEEELEFLQLALELYARDNAPPSEQTVRKELKARRRRSSSPVRH